MIIIIASIFFSLFNRLLIGFVTTSKDKVNLPIDSCSIDLNEFNVHHPPDTYEFDFITGAWKVFFN